MDLSHQTPPPSAPPSAADQSKSDPEYRRLHRIVLLSTIAVSIAPLLLLAAVNYSQYDRAARNEAQYAIHSLTSRTRRSLEFFLEERLAELSYITHDNTIEELQSDDELARILGNMNQSMPQRAFVDLGLIDARGNQLSYVGPYELHGKAYADQEWFQEVHRRGVYISDVFLGHRGSPHFVLAICHDRTKEESHVVRATIDTQMLDGQLTVYGLSPSSDCFIVNHDAVLQTPSRRYGKVLDQCPLTLPPETPETMVVDWRDERGRDVVFGYAFIEDSPFILIMLARPHDIMGSWLSVRGNLLLFLVASVLVILGVVFWSSSVLVKQLRVADAHRARLRHGIEYANKLASLGRLAAGTAHEINNPLAIIKENAGLLHDLYTLGDGGSPPPEKITRLTLAIQQAVDRCSTVTHRLLGFAKHMDVRLEPIDVRLLVQDVLTFHDKEIGHRNLNLDIQTSDDVPVIESDRGQLQQVFLNLINNAFAAVSDGGRIRITISRSDEGTVVIAVADDGVGIPKEDLPRVFEPFFTTKGEHGTGLGLSVTYGIVQRLGGRISVDSELGHGACFTVSLPVKPNR